METFLRTEFNYDMNEASVASGLDCSGSPSMAKQSFAEECDINTIVRRFGLMGEMPVGVRMPTYGDFTGISNFQDAMNAIIAAEEAFMQMPAHVRARFHNDPAEFVDFCSDKANVDEAVKLGLAVPKAEALMTQGASQGGSGGTGTPAPASAPAGSSTVST